MLVDDVTVRFRAGHGGKGAVAFQKVRLMQGPTGADGGRGASIYLEGVTDIGALRPFASKKEIYAENGKNGRGQFIDGRAGEDLILKVPVGVVCTNLETGDIIEIVKPGERVLIAEGGAGGWGNFKFRSSVNTTPQQFRGGLPGQEVTFKIELRLIADVGLIGLPNAGKSSLLNELTAAKSKVANYAFTTLEPHLGAYYTLILADIPGLIEGASEGKGLGVKFLRHIERTKTLFHLVSAESDDVVRDYTIVRKELEQYGTELAGKEEYVFLTKTDAVSEAEAREKLSELQAAGITAVPISLLDPQSLQAVQAILNTLKQ